MLLLLRRQRLQQQPRTGRRRGTGAAARRRGGHGARAVHALLELRTRKWLVMAIKQLEAKVFVLRNVAQLFCSSPLFIPNMQRERSTTHPSLQAVPSHDARRVSDAVRAEMFAACHPMSYPRRAQY